MKKKLAIGVTAAFLTLGSGTGLGLYSYNQEVLAKEAIQLEQLRVETLDNAEAAVDSLYNSTRTKLSANLEENITVAEGLVEKVDDEKAKAELEKEISQVKEIASVEVEVQSVLNKGVLKESVTAEQLEEITQKLIVIKSINEPIYSDLTEYLVEAEAQLKAINVALNKVKEATNSLDRTAYDNALSHVEKVKNEVKKDELKGKLAEVDKKIVALEEEKKAEEERLAAEKAAAEKLAAEQAAAEVAAAEAAEQAEQAAAQSTSVAATGSTSTSGSSGTSSNASYSGSSQSSSGSSSSSSSTASVSQPKASTSAGSSSSSSSSASKPASAPATSAPASSGGSSSGSGSSDSNSGSSEPNYDDIGESMENIDWSNTGSGDIDDGGNTWDSWN